MLNDEVIFKAQAFCAILATLGLYFVSVEYGNFSNIVGSDFSSDNFGLLWSGICVNLLASSFFMRKAAHVGRALATFLIVTSYTVCVCSAKSAFQSELASNTGLAQADVNLYRCGAFFLLFAGVVSFLLMLVGQFDYSLSRLQGAKVQSIMYLLAALLYVIGSILLWAKSKENVCLSVSSRTTIDLMTALLLVVGVVGGSVELLDFAFMLSVNALFIGFLEMERMLGVIGSDDDKGLTKGQMALVLTAALLVMGGAVVHSVVAVHPPSTDANRTASPLTIALGILACAGVTGAGLIFGGADTKTPLGRTSIWFGVFAGVVGPISAVAAHVLQLPGLALVNAASTLVTLIEMRNLSSGAADRENRAGIQLVMATSFLCTAGPLFAKMERISLADIVSSGKRQGGRVLVALVVLFIGVSQQYRNGADMVWSALLEVVLGLAVVLGGVEWAGRLASLSLTLILSSLGWWLLSTIQVEIISLIGAWAFVLVTAIPDPGDVSVPEQLHPIHDLPGGSLVAAQQPLFTSNTGGATYNSIDFGATSAAPPPPPPGSQPREDKVADMPLSSVASE